MTHFLDNMFNIFIVTNT